MGYSKEWNEVLEFICDFEDKTFMSRVWFRGHSNSSYSLKSGLFREKHDDLFNYLYIEATNFDIFRSLGSHLHNNLRDWELLFLMQHHGVKTRLLDWTESFAVALFFACAGWNDNDSSARIWLLDPAELNLLSIETPNAIGVNSIGAYEKTIQEPYTFHDSTVAIYPPRNNNRISRQRGTFTLQGNTLSALDEEFNGELVKSKKLSFIDLQPNVREDAIRYLNQSGIDYFSMYPDLEGLARYVNDYSTSKNLSRNIMPKNHI
ncbi:FRG domain-containing protein [Paenibacillus sp. 276b]|uniref:FRG domain-containing protein n=1 Tax=Paenibacillus sp. 276b TaxID=1566277 RepID=UPI00089D2541|nr:FRG domain-containing protein [Paenibacillus sp. 276b]SEB27508.1 FRG domain-containing protein [Paenibacillus sp. 276b]